MKRMFEIGTNFVSHVPFKVAPLLDGGAAQGAEDWTIPQGRSRWVDEPADLLLNRWWKIQKLWKIE